jgi:hypothetical protein
MLANEGGGASELSGRVGERMGDVINAITFCVIAKALTQHLAEAHRKQWSLPTRCGQGAPGRQEEAVETEDEAELVIEGMMPYWMDPSAAGLDALGGGGGARAGSVVPNDISIDRMVVLTGPNTAGDVSARPSQHLNPKLPTPNTAGRVALPPHEPPPAGSRRRRLRQHPASASRQHAPRRSAGSQQTPSPSP